MTRRRNQGAKLGTIILLIIFIIIFLYSRYNKSTHSSRYDNDDGHSLIDSRDEGTWNHIYHNNRLKVLKGRITATGVIVAIRVERDGDEHILLHLDAGQDNLLNDKNITEQKGDLVLEPICVNEVRQKDAIEPCKGYLNDVTIPSVGDTVSATGTFVLDMEHGWNEIHPVISIIEKRKNIP